jgi:hypothetical protein
MNCCFGPKQMEPFVIPARSETEIECEATSDGPGPFSCPMLVTYFDGDIRAIKLSVRGTWVAPRNADHASKPPS